MNSGLILGKYQVIRELGRGGMGQIYLVRDINMGTFWALKVVLKDPRNSVNYYAEFNILRRLNHPSIVKMFNFFEDQNYIYIIEEFVDGINLEQYLRQVRRLPELVIVSIARQICNVLLYLHSQRPNPIVYRDMKPANIMLMRDGRIKIVDFGIAREYKQYARNDTMLGGTRGYAAPEQYGNAQTDVRADIYSLGVTMYHMASGLGPNDPPYEILPVRQFDPNFSEGLEEIIFRCTRLNPDNRYQDIRQVLQALSDIERQRYRRGKGSGLKTALWVLFLTAILGVLFFGFWQYKDNITEMISNIIGTISGT
ncbi:MAG: serine/threonine-protein kinase [Bacillota bacterium]|nr:serine/threonine-protein kinase [Bacillota bacterium]